MDFGGRQSQHHPMSAAAMQRSVLDALFVTRSAVPLPELVTDDHALHQNLLPTDIVGSAGLRTFFERAWTVFNRGMIQTTNVVEAGDRTLTHAVISLKHVGAIGAVSPTLGFWQLELMLVSRLAGHRLAESWLETNALDILTRMGGWHVPTAHLVSVAPPVVNAEDTA